MFKKVVTAMLLISIVFYSFGCFTQTHIVGKGAQSSQVLEQRQWYILWGLVPLNTVDSHSMAGGSANYTIQTSHTFIDWAISIFTSIATIYPATIKVMK